MITPPSSTQSFYSMLMTSAAGTAALKGFFDPGADIENVLITSLDFQSDVQAMVECQESIERVAAKMEVTEVDRKVDFNPLYLPNVKDLFETVEFDGDGDISKVAGFGNPFVTATMKLSAPEQPVFVDASVCWKQFELPPVKELFANDKKVLLS